ncbi:hypothetical protein [Labrys neptuniae]
MVFAIQRQPFEPGGGWRYRLIVRFFKKFASGCRSAPASFVLVTGSGHASVTGALFALLRSEKETA